MQERAGGVKMGNDRSPSEWGTPAGTTIVSPALAVSSSPSRVNMAWPEVMMKRSSWRGWMCSVIAPPGTLRHLNRTSCPSLSSATAVNSIHSPVAGLKKGRKPVIVRSPGRVVVGLAEQVLGDRGLLALRRDDGPRRQVGQDARAAGDDGHDRHDHPDQGHVPAEVVGGSGADPGHHPVLPAAYQHLGAVCAVHAGHPFNWSGGRPRMPGLMSLGTDRLGCGYLDRACSGAVVFVDAMPGVEAAQWPAMPTLCRDTAGRPMRHKRRAVPANKKVLPYAAWPGCALGAAEVQSSRNLDLVYTRINEHDFLFARYARSAGETREPPGAGLPSVPSRDGTAVRVSTSA